MAQPRPIAAPEILARLESVGTYAFHRPSLLGRWIGVPAEIEWDSPAGFESDLAKVTLAFWFPASKNAAADDLPRLLDAMDEFRARLPNHVTVLRSYLIECFRECYESQLEEFDRQRLADTSGTIFDAAILGDVQSLHLRFDATGKAVVRTAWIAVGWDDEHGVDVEWDAAGEPIRPWRDMGDNRR